MEMLKTNNFVAVKRPKNLSSQVAEQLMDSINKGVFTSGDYLPSENKLVEIFKVSRGVIREALLMLSAKGIIEIQKGRGAQILHPSIDPMLDSFALLVNHKCGDFGLKYAQEARVLVEPQIAAVAAKFRKDEDLDKLQQCLVNMDKYKEDKKLLSFYDIEFHKQIASSCGNPIFSITLEPIFHFLQVYHQEIFIGVDSKTLENSLMDHENIFKAIKERNSNTAFNTMKQHFTIANNAMEKLLPY